MKNFFSSISGKRFKYGTYSTVSVIAVIALIVVINLIFQQIDIKIDTTPEKLYTLTDKTKEIIGNLDEDITIYALFRTGSETALIAGILDQFPVHSSRIKVERRDPILYPAFVAQYESKDQVVETDSLIVVSSKRSKIIQPSEFMGQNDENANTVNIEPKIINAIQYVLKESTTKIYAVSGHNEYLLPDSYISAFKDINYEYDTCELLLNDIPEDCAALIIASPERDYSPDEAAKIENYLKNNGRLMIFLDLDIGELPNLSRVMANYGISFGQEYVLETDTNNYYSNNSMILPNFNDHQIMRNLLVNDYPILIMGCRPINISDILNPSTTVTPLLTTSGISFGKSDPNSKNMSMEEGDIAGPFNLAVAIEDAYTLGGTSYTTRIVAVGTTSMLADSVNEIVYGTDLDFFMESALWVAPQSDDMIYISPRILANSGVLTMTERDAVILKISSAAVIPALIFGTGIIIWVRRRNK